MKRIWRISPKLKEQVRHLPPELKQRFWDSADVIMAKPETGKLLSEELEGYRSYRLGKYRLIYRVTPDRLILEAFGPRSGIYERLVLEIGRQKIRERSAQYSRSRIQPRKTGKSKSKPSLRSSRIRV